MRAVPITVGRKPQTFERNTQICGRLGGEPDLTREVLRPDDLHGDGLRAARAAEGPRGAAGLDGELMRSMWRLLVDWNIAWERGAIGSADK